VGADRGGFRRGACRGGFRLAVAEEKNFRIPKLELTIAENKSQIADLTTQIEALKEDIMQKADRIATLNLQLVEQAKASKDKLSMVNDAQSRLCKALISLSEAALNCDNDEFIKAMESNLSAFEESLLEDISRWQERKRPARSEVCQVADSEQLVRPLPCHDEKLEELISQEQPAQDTDTTAESPSEQSGIDAVSPDESAVESTERPEVTDSDTDDAAVADEESARTEVILESAEADTTPLDQAEEEDDDDTEQKDLITLQTEADVAALAERLDEEISFEFDDDDEDDDAGEDSPAASVPEPPLRLEVEEVPSPPAESQAELTLKDDADEDEEDPLKKKLNTQPAPPQARKKAV